MYDNPFPLQKLKDKYSREIIFSKQELQCLPRSVFRSCNACLEAREWHLEPLVCNNAI